MEVIGNFNKGSLLKGSSGESENAVCIRYWRIKERVDSIKQSSMEWAYNVIALPDSTKGPLKLMAINLKTKIKWIKPVDMGTE